MDYFHDGEDATIDLEIEKLGRRIFHRRHMFDWEASEAINDLTAFVCRMNEEVKGTVRPLDSNAADTLIPWSSGVNVVMVVLQNVLERLAAAGDPSVPDNGTASRNFAEFHRHIRNDSHTELVRMYGDRCKHLIVELPVYLERSFGDPHKTQYGIEHELSFVMFLIGLYKLNCLTHSDGQFIVCSLFDRYDRVQIQF